ncbi:MAG TPA: hypothetical protein VGZ32_18290 [Actinocrinis sp.]|uniref:hypothetical protein n=1 Tax=Actinocrinis sp. TaxID=1920516 RepID=UPI002DDD6BD2|nr:hypothetical protein [Actinocrinis sp.]HEV3172303.1 hypothetical protein [Actinocrinis sp.]
MAERKGVLLRLDPAVYDALTRWASDELRSTTAQIELLLRRALADAGRLPPNVGGLPRRGRPPKSGSVPAPVPDPDADAAESADAPDQAAGPP